MSVKKGFFRNTAIMLAAMFIVKALGAVLKIPLGNILGGEGMGYFSTAFSIFSPVLAFTCSGIPAIVTQVTARELSQGRWDYIVHFRRSALILGGAGGIIGTAVIYIAAVPFTCYLANSPESLMSVMMIAPSVFFCSVTAVYRGYYEGLSDMLPTAVSQVAEAVVKAGVGVGLSYYVYNTCVHKFGSEEQALPYAAAAAVFGVTVSEIFGFLVIVLQSRKADRKNLIPKSIRKIGSVWETAREIFIEALPVAFGAVISNLISFTDLLTISNCINISYSRFPNQLAGGAAAASELSGIDDIGNFLYGSYSGMVVSVYLLTATLPMLVSRCSLPRIICTIELAKNSDNTPVKRDISFMLKGTMLISAPVSLFMAALAEPVLHILYPVRELEAMVGVIPLQILSIGGIFAALEGALLSVFQAYGDFKTAVRATVFGGFFKFLLNIVLLLIPGVNICGAAAATTVSNALATVYVMHRLKAKYNLTLSYGRVCFPYLISASISSIAGFFAYKAFSVRLSSIISVALTCVGGGLLYFLVLLMADSGDLVAVIRGIKNKKYAKVL